MDVQFLPLEELLMMDMIASSQNELAKRPLGNIELSWLRASQFEPASVVGVLRLENAPAPVTTYHTRRLLPYFCTNRGHFNFFIQTERVSTLKNVSKSRI
jgi:hypothetical protein